MRQGSRYIKIKDKPLFCLKGVLGWCFAVFFSFFFLLTQISQFANCQIEEWETGGNSTVLSNASFVAGDHQPGRLPLGTGQSPVEPKSADESEYNDFDDDSDNLNSNQFPEKKFILNSVKCLLSNLLHSIENRSKVSLIILHHSWKSFLI